MMPDAGKNKLLNVAVDVWIAQVHDDLEKKWIPTMAIALKKISKCSDEEAIKLSWALLVQAAMRGAGLDMKLDVKLDAE